MSSDDGIEYQKSLQHHHHHQHNASSSSSSSTGGAQHHQHTHPHQHQHHQSQQTTGSSASSCSLALSGGVVPNGSGMSNSGGLNSGGGGPTLTHSHSSHGQHHASTQRDQQQQMVNNGAGSNTIARRKASLSYQQQSAADSLSLAPAPSNSVSVGVGGNFVSVSASPNRYSAHQPEGYHHIGGRLSIHPIDRYEDTMTCCLPPPSPAPTSDRFVMGIPSPSPIGGQNCTGGGSSINGNGGPTSSGPPSIGGNVGHHFQDQQQQQQQSSQQTMVTANAHKYAAAAALHRTMSPSSRFRMSDRYRDASPKCDRFVTATHFLANSTPLVSSDSYTYLSSTVHTPVKRYVPTPPPPTEVYSDIPQSSSSTSSNSGYHTISTSPHLPHHHQQQQQQQQQQQHQQQQQQIQQHTLPYRFRMKCCSADPSAPPPSSLPLSSVTGHDRGSGSDHYATPPRVRPLKCSAPGGNGCSTAAINNGNSSQGTQGILAQVGPTPGTVVISAPPPSQGVRQARPTCVVNDYMPRTPSVEYLGSAGGRVVTPVSVMSEPTNGTCLHCNTIRRTTGVHQTTQTTGPISPIPQTQNLALGTSSLTGGNNNSSSGSNNNSGCTLGGIASQLDTASDMTSTASPTPSSTNHSQISPMSPPIAGQPSEQQQQQQIQQCPMQQQIQQQQQQQQSSSAIGGGVGAITGVGMSQQQQHPSASVLSSHSSLANRNLQAQQQIVSHHHHSTAASNSNIVNMCNNSNSSSNNNNNNNNNNSSNVGNTANGGNGGGGMISTTPQRSTLTIRQQMQQRFTRKQRLKEYIRREIAKFFGVDVQSEDEERIKWSERQKRLAMRRFGPLKSDNEFGLSSGRGNQQQQPAGDRPDILPAQTTDEPQISRYETNGHIRVPIERKASVPTMILSGVSYIIQTLNKRQQRQQKQWSRSFAPAHVTAINGENPGDMCEGLTALQEDEVFFDTPSNDLGGTGNTNSTGNNVGAGNTTNGNGHHGNNARSSNANIIEHSRQIYMGERVHGWRTSANIDHHHQQHHQQQQQQQQQAGNEMMGGNGVGAAGVVVAGEQAIIGNGGVGMVSGGIMGAIGVQRIGYRGTRISSQLLDGVLDNSRRPLAHKVKLFRAHELDDRNDHRPFFTYWINTVQILVLTLSLICYGIGPIGIGVEQKSGQVLVTSLSLQTVQHQEQRNVWIGPRGNDLVHLGAKFAACMRRDIKIMDVISKTRRQERETACCIRNDDSGCVQSSQADCSVRGLWPTKSISTWKKWSPGESGPGGRISGSVCGLDPKYCDAPASIAPYEWPDDITKWPICRKTNSFSQRFRFKDQTAEHMVCEVIGHPCCTGVFGECRITTREYCDFVNGYFHEEASLCSQVSCLNNVCGMFPFLSTEVPDQFYRLFTSLCLHAGILHLAITIAFQHIFLADLERLIGPIRTAIVYIGSGLAGNLTSAILVPYKPEVGPLASLAGVISSLVVLLLLMHWKHLKKPHLALVKLIIIAGTLFGMGTLPWQQNFAGLIAGIFCGILLTIALVPFVSITKYGRKTKINLIWTCMIFHLFIYTIMFVIFYVFPSEFTSFNFGDVLNGGMGTTGLGNTVIGGGLGHHHQQHHHHSDDIIMTGGGSMQGNGGGGPNGGSNGITGGTPGGSGGATATFNANYVGGGGSGRNTIVNVQQQQQMLQQSPHYHRVLGSSGNSIVSCDKGACTTSTIGNDGVGGGDDLIRDTAASSGVDLNGAGIGIAIGRNNLVSSNGIDSGGRIGNNPLAVDGNADSTSGHVININGDTRHTSGSNDIGGGISASSAMIGRNTVMGVSSSNTGSLTVASSSLSSSHRIDNNGLIGGNVLSVSNAINQHIITA